MAVNHTVLQTWTEVCHQIFGDWEEQTYVKFTKELVKYMEKQVLIKKMFTNSLNMGLKPWAWVENEVHGVETHWLSCKENILGAVVSKEGYADSVLRHERTHHYWFPPKKCNYQ